MAIDWYSLKQQQNEALSPYSNAAAAQQGAQQLVSTMRTLQVDNGMDSSYTMQNIYKQVGQQMEGILLNHDKGTALTAIEQNDLLDSLEIFFPHMTRQDLQNNINPLIKLSTGIDVDKSGWKAFSEAYDTWRLQKKLSQNERKMAKMDPNSEAYKKAAEFSDKLMVGIAKGNMTYRDYGALGNEIIENGALTAQLTEQAMYMLGVTALSMITAGVAGGIMGASAGVGFSTGYANTLAAMTAAGGTIATTAAGNPYITPNVAIAGVGGKAVIDKGSASPLAGGLMDASGKLEGTAARVLAPRGSASALQYIQAATQRIKTWELAQIDAGSFMYELRNTTDENGNKIPNNVIDAMGTGYGIAIFFIEDELVSLVNPIAKRFGATSFLQNVNGLTERLERAYTTGIVGAIGRYGISTTAESLQEGWEDVTSEGFKFLAKEVSDIMGATNFNQSAQDALVEAALAGTRTFAQSFKSFGIANFVPGFLFGTAMDVPGWNIVQNYQANKQAKKEKIVTQQMQQDADKIFAEGGTTINIDLVDTGDAQYSPEVEAQLKEQISTGKLEPIRTSIDPVTLQRKPVTTEDAVKIETMNVAGLTSAIKIRTVALSETPADINRQEMLAFKDHLQTDMQDSIVGTSGDTLFVKDQDALNQVIESLDHFDVRYNQTRNNLLVYGNNDDGQAYSYTVRIADENTNNLDYTYTPFKQRDTSNLTQEQVNEELRIEDSFNAIKEAVPFVSDAAAYNGAQAMEDLAAITGRSAEEIRNEGIVFFQEATDAEVAKMKKEYNIPEDMDLNGWMHTKAGNVYQINVSHTAKPTTIAHEVGHVIRAMSTPEQLSGFVGLEGFTGEAGAMWRSDIKQTADGKWQLGDKIYDTYNEAARQVEKNEEKFVQMYMQYKRDGIAPNESVAGTFQRMSDFINAIRMDSDKINISPEARAALDQLYNTQGTGIAASAETGDLLETGYHGTAADFDRFDFSKIGTGEGAQAFGWGGYVTDSPGIGKAYAKADQNRKGGLFLDSNFAKQRTEELRNWIKDFEYMLPILEQLDDEPIQYKFLETLHKIADRERNAGNISDYAWKFLDRGWLASKNVLLKTINATLGESRKELQLIENSVNVRRNLYKVEIPDWDDGTHVYNQWDEKVNVAEVRRLLDALEDEGVPGANEIYSDEEIASWKGEDLYNYLANTLKHVEEYILEDKADEEGWSDSKLNMAINDINGYKLASEFLSKQGYTGNRYEAERHTRKPGQAAHHYNYVIFDENDIEIKQHWKYDTDEEGRPLFETAVRENDRKISERVMDDWNNVEKEIQQHPEKYYDSEGNLLAPNGQKSNLDYNTYVMVRTPAFINWFGDWINDPENASKVVDENGEPLAVYHGSNEDTRFSVFKEASHGIFFSDNKAVAEEISRENYGTQMYEVFLNSRNPLVLDAKGNEWTRVLTDEEAAQLWLTEYARPADKAFSEEPGYYSANDIGRVVGRMGYDGVIIKNVMERYWIPASVDFIVFNPNQIKSVNNNGEFSTSNDNILFEVSRDKPLTAGEAQKVLSDVAAIADPMPAAEEITEEAWNNEFKEELIDPTGRTIKMGPNQYAKIMGRDYGTRSAFWKMIRPTVETPSIIIEELQGTTATGGRNYIKAFSGDKVRWFMSISVNNEEIGDVIISNRRIDEGEILKRIEKNLVTYTITDNGQQATSGLDHQAAASLNETLPLAETEVNPQVYTNNFKNWFGDWQNDPENSSKVVNEDGTPMVLYHGSPVADIQIFSPTGRTNNGDGLIYATNEKTVADIFAKEHVEGSSAFRIRFTGNIGEVYPLYMNMKHPLDFRNLTDDEKALITKLYAEDWYLTDETAKKNFDMAYEAGNHQYVKDMARRIVNNLPAYGYDGLIANMLSNWQAEQDGAQYQEYAVVSSNQVKSAERNSGAFNPNEENYLFETTAEKIQNLEAQKQQLIEPYAMDIERAVELGEYIADEYLQYFKDQQWAKDILEAREALKEMPELLEEAKEAETFEDWLYTSQLFDGYNMSDDAKHYLQTIYNQAHQFTPEQQDRVFAQEWTASDEKMLELSEKLSNYRTYASARQQRQNPGRMYTSRFGAYKGVSRDVLFLRRNDGTSASGKTYTRSTHEQIEAAKKKIQDNPRPYRLAYLQAYGANEAAARSAAEYRDMMEYGVQNLNYKLDQLFGSVDEEIANARRRQELIDSGQGYKVTIEDLQAKIARAEEDLKDLQIDKDISEKELRNKLESLQDQYETERDLHNLYRKQVEELKQDRNADEKKVEAAQKKADKAREKLETTRKERDRYKNALDAVRRRNEAVEAREQREKTIKKILKAANFSNSTLDVSYESIFAWVRNLFAPVDRKALYEERRKLMSQLSEAATNGNEERAAELTTQLEDVRQRIKASEQVEIPENARTYFNDAIMQKADNRQSAWTQDELDYLLNRVQKMRDDARMKLELKNAARMTERNNIADDFFAENYGTRPQSFIREDVKAYPAHDKNTSELVQKLGLIYFVANVTPARSARFVDGQSEGVAYNEFIRKAWQAQTNEIGNSNSRYAKGVQTMKELGIKISQLRKKGYTYTKANGEQVKLTRGQMIGVYVYTKSDVGAQKIMSILGNGIPYETAFDIINSLTDAERAWGDFLVNDMSNNAWDRLSAVMENEYNQTMGRRENYFPLVASGKFTEGEGDLLAGPTQMKVRYADKGFTKSVNPYAIYELDLDVTDTWRNQVRRQEHFIAYAAWAREANYLLVKGGMGDVIKQKYGNNYLQNLQDHVNYVGSPQTTMDNIDKTFSSLIGRFAGSKVVGNLSAMLKQLPTMAAAIGNTTAKNFFRSVIAPKVTLNQFLKANNLLDPNSDGYKNMQQFIFENAPEMKNRRYGSLLLEGMDNIGKSSFDAFRNEMNARIGQYTLNLTDGFVTQRLWLARYLTVMEELQAKAEKNGEVFDQNAAHKEASFKASQLISETQNTAVSMDLSQNMRKAAGGDLYYKSRFLFGSATMNLFNMVAYDLPYIIKTKDLTSSQKIAKGIGIVAFTLINIVSMMAIGGVFARKDGEDDEEYAKRVAEEAAMTVVGDALPGWGSSITNAYQGYSGSNTMSLFEDIGSTAKKVTSADEWEDFADILSWLVYAGASAAGLPATGGKKIWQSISELNPGYLLNKNWADWFEENVK